MKKTIKIMNATFERFNPKKMMMVEKKISKLELNIKSIKIRTGLEYKYIAESVIEGNKLTSQRNIRVEFDPQSQKMYISYPLYVGGNSPTARFKLAVKEAIEKIISEYKVPKGVITQGNVPCIVML